MLFTARIIIVICRMETAWGTKLHRGLLTSNLEVPIIGLNFKFVVAVKIQMAEFIVETHPFLKRERVRKIKG